MTTGDWRSRSWVKLKVVSQSNAVGPISIEGSFSSLRLRSFTIVDPANLICAQGGGSVCYTRENCNHIAVWYYRKWSAQERQTTMPSEKYRCTDSRTNASLIEITLRWRLPGLTYRPKIARPYVRELHVTLPQTQVMLRTRQKNSWHSV